MTTTENYETLLSDNFRIVAIEVFEDNDLMWTKFNWNDNLQLFISDYDYDMDDDKYKIAIEVKDFTLSSGDTYKVLSFMFGIIEDEAFRIRHKWTTMICHNDEWEELIYSDNYELIDAICDYYENTSLYKKYF